MPRPNNTMGESSSQRLMLGCCTYGNRRAIMVCFLVALKRTTARHKYVDVATSVPSKTGGRYIDESAVCVLFWRVPVPGVSNYSDSELMVVDLSETHDRYESWSYYNRVSTMQ